MRRIAVRTDDFRLSFHLMRELKRRKCDFVMLSSGEKWDGVLLTSPEEVQDGEIPATEETLEISVERAIQASGLGFRCTAIFGVDPGPRPGIAWLAMELLSVALNSSKSIV